MLFAVENRVCPQVRLCSSSTLISGSKYHSPFRWRSEDNLLRFFRLQERLPKYVFLFVLMSVSLIWGSFVNLPSPVQAHDRVGAFFTSTLAFPETDRCAHQQILVEKGGHAWHILCVEDLLYQEQLRERPAD